MTLGYVLAVAFANLTAAVFLPLPLGLSVSVGTFVFSASFVCRDRLHREGKRAVYRAIAIAALVGTLETALLGMPWRIVAASTLALVLAETADTETFARIEGSWLARALRSNLVSCPLDTAIFTLVAFAGVLPAMQLAGLIVGETLAKWVIAACMSVGLRRRLAWT